MRPIVILFAALVNFRFTSSKGDDTYITEPDVSHLKSSSIQTTSLLLFKCPEQFGYYPDVGNCTKYYVCVFGEALHESCTGGLYFSSELQTCDWPRNVRCATNYGNEISDQILPYNQFGEGDTLRIEYEKESPIQIKTNQQIENNQQIDYNRNRQLEVERVFNIELNRKSVTHSKSDQNFSTTLSPNSEEVTETQIDDISRVNNELNNKLIKEDLQNPGFEEAIASIFDENGGIHLHDGPGGLFGLVPPDTVSDHNVNVFSIPAIQENMEKQIKDKSNKKEVKYNDYNNRNDRNSRPKVVHFDDDIESELLTEKIRNDLRKEEVKLQPTFKSTVDLKSTQPETQTKPKPKAEQINRVSNLNKIQIFNNSFNKASTLLTRIPRFQQQRLQQEKHFNPQKIELNPIVKYIKSEEPVFSTEPFTQMPLNYTSFEPLQQQRSIQTSTSSPSIFYSYRNNDNYRKPKTTPIPLNITINSFKRPTQGSYLRHSNLEKSSNTKTDKSYLKTASVPTRPLSLFSTPDPLVNAIKCNEKVCRLPDCFCGGIETPVGLSPKQIPQIVLITFDDAVNDVNWHIYEEIFNTERKNPNGCPIRATFYVSHEWTDYGQVQTLYSRGHEIASHSITHSFGERFSKSQWIKEINGQREIIHSYSGVKLEDIRGMRAPFLQIGGNKQFEMLYETNFTYDSSMSIFENSPPFWPYTLDYTINHECMIAPCPTKSFPGLWEIGLVMWKDLRGGRCSMGDACSNPSDEDGVYDMIMKNFNRHYQSNRAPFGLYYHSAWFNSRHHKSGFLKFIDEVLKLNDVYFVTNWQLIQWMREPTPISRIHKFNPWKCQPKDENRPPACLNPTVCNVNSKSGSRFFKTCQPCPESYPWLENTGIKKKI